MGLIKNPLKSKPRTGRQWNKEPVDGALAIALRRGIRQRRREKGRGGHRFRYDDLRSFWSLGENIAVVDHREDRWWQVWIKDSERGWYLEGWHRRLKDAQAQAEKPRPKPKPLPKPKIPPGKYVHAAWSIDRYRRKDGRPMVVRCQSDYTAGVISEVFQRLGCATEIKEVA